MGVSTRGWELKGVVGSGKAKALQGEADRLPCCDETSQRNANLSLKKSESSGQGLR